MISEMQIETAMRYHLIPGSMSIIKEKNRKCCQECGEIRILLILCTVNWGVKWCAIIESSIEAPQKIRNKITVSSSSSILEYLSKKNWNQNLKSIYALSCSLQHYSQ